MNPPMKRVPGMIFTRKTQIQAKQEANSSQQYSSMSLQDYNSSNALKQYSKDQDIPFFNDSQEEEVLPSKSYRSLKNKTKQDRIQNKQPSLCHFDQKMFSIIPSVFLKDKQEHREHSEHKQKLLNPEKGPTKCIEQKGKKDKVQTNYLIFQKMDLNHLTISETNTEIQRPQKNVAAQLPPETLVQQPYIQYTYVEENLQTIPQPLRPEHQTTELDEQIEEIRLQEDIEQIKRLFQNLYSQNKANAIQPSATELFHPYKFFQKTPRSIVSQIPIFIHQFILLKNIQKSLNALKAQNLIKKSQKQPKKAILYGQIQRLNSFLLGIQSYQGVDDIFAADNKIEQIKRFFVFLRFCLIATIYVIVLGRFEQYKNYLANLIKFCIENLLILLNNTFKSRSLHYLIQTYYPHLYKKGLDFIKVNNDAINQILHKISCIDQLFFTNFNKLAKKCIQFPLNSMFKQFLEFLAFNIHKNHLQSQGKCFSTAVAPFLKINSEKYYLIIDATQFYAKDLKGDVKHRPFSQNFLKQISQKYDLINYSYLSTIKTKQILADFDRQKLIKHQLYSHHFETEPKLHRCLQKMGISRQNYIYLNFDQDQDVCQKIALRKWNGQKKDRQLIDILPILIAISHLRLNCSQICHNLTDCNQYISKMQQKMFKILK